MNPPPEGTSTTGNAEPPGNPNGEDHSPSQTGIAPQPSLLPNARQEWFNPRKFAMLLALFILALYPDVILGGRTFYYRDFGNYCYPLAHYHRECFWRGEIPLWNPLSFCGLPFLAQWNTGTLYPGALLYLLLPLSWALAVFCLVHLWFGGLGTFLIVKRWTQSASAAAVAGFGFAFSGLAMHSLMWPSVSATLGWMPWVIIATERATTAGGRWLFLAAGAGAMQMLAGTPEFIFCTWAIGGTLILFQSVCRRPLNPRPLMRLLAVVSLVTGLAAVQLLPFFQLLQSSQRTGSVSIREWAMPGMGWANFVVPLFGMVRSVEGVFFQYSQQWASSYYTGILTLLLALLAIWRARELKVRVLALVAVAGLVLALGPNSPVYAPLRRLIPQLGLMQFAIKFVVIPTFILPLLAGIGFAQLQEFAAQNKAKFVRPLAVLWALLIATVAGLLLYQYLHPQLDGWTLPWNATFWSGVSRALLLSVGVGLLLAWQRGTNKVLHRGVCLAFPLLVAVDGMTHAPRQNPTVPRFVYEPGLLQLEPRPRHGEARVMISREAHEALVGIKISDPLKAYTLKRLALFGNCNLTDAIAKVDGLFPLTLREYDDLQSLVYHESNVPLPGLLNFLGVAHQTSPTNYFEWHRRASFAPLITAGQRPEFVGPSNALRAVTRPDFDGRATVYLTPDAADEFNGIQAARIEVTNRRIEAQRIQADVDADTPGVMVIAQAYYPNWRAYVDGKPVTLWRANYAFQALKIPAGKHEVRLQYLDRPFQIGLTISLLTLAACAAGWFAPTFRPAVPGLTPPNIGSS